MNYKKILSTLGLAACGSWSIGVGAVESESAILAVVQTSQQRPAISVGATIEPIKQVTFSAQMPGRIVQLAGEEGSEFQKGEVLVSLDTAELQAQRQALQAQLQSADMAWRNAWVQRERSIASPQGQQTPGGMGMPGLFDRMVTQPFSQMLGARDFGMEREADVFANTTQLEQARHSISQVQATLAQLDTQFRNAKSIAPFTGTVVQKLVEQGDTVQPGQPLVIFADLSRLQVVADLPVRLAQSLKTSDVLSIETANAEQQYPVTVATIFPTADSIRHTIRVKFDLPEKTQLAAGVYVKLQLPDPLAQKQPRLYIPKSAVIQRGGLPMVFVVRQQMTELRLVRLGAQLSAANIEVLYGLQAGEQLLAQPSSTQRAGQRINVEQTHAHTAN